MPNDLLVLLNKNLDIHLKQYLPAHTIAQVYNYAIFPPGKLFRPQLVFAIAKDFQHPENEKIISQWHHSLDNAYLASLVEIHHAYTLVHDDLPAMDNDLIRRNKPSTHAKFGEWQALLVGDGLLNISYQLMKNISSEKLPTMLALAGHCLGPKGLIHGQVLDLSEEMNDSFSSLIRTHELKTGRLIQLAIVGSYLLLNQTDTGIPQYRTAINLAKLGQAMGIVFQLLDDITELVDKNLNDHEMVINPWFNFTTLAFEELINRMQTIKSIQQQYKLNEFNSVLQFYYSKIHRKLQIGQANIMLNLSKQKFSHKQLDLIMQLL